MGLFNFWKKEEPKQVRMVRPKNKRSTFSASETDRFTSGWTSTPTPINSVLFQELQTMRARSRDLAKNNDYIRRFLQLARTNVIGSKGIQLQSLVTNTKNGLGKTGEPDIEARDAIEAAWKRFARKGAGEYTGRLTLTASEMLMIEQLLRDGEIIILKLHNASNEFNFQYQIIDPELLSVSMDKFAKTGNVVRMGVEMDSSNRPVAYWMASSDPHDYNYQVYGGKGYRRYPAEQIIHSFLMEYSDQVRGYPAGMASAMRRLKQLDGYEEAEVIAARVGASKMGFFERSDDGAGYGGEEYDEEGNPVSTNDDLFMEAEAGTFEMLPNGVKLATFDPNHPAGAYQAFVKTILRGISAGLGVGYNTLSNDLEGVNFSSIRTSVLEDREVWKALQEWLIENVLTELFEDWLESSLLAGAIKTPVGTLKAKDIEKHKAAVFQARRWSWIDPLKDVKASVEAINNNIKTISDVIREGGRDPDDVFRERKREIELMKELGIYQEPAETAGFFMGEEKPEDDEEKSQ